MSGKLTNAERDAIDEFVRVVVLGHREKIALVESLGSTPYPPLDSGAHGPFWGPAASASYAGYGGGAIVAGDGGGADGGGGE